MLEINRSLKRYVVGASLALCAVPLSAHATDVAIKVEPGVTIPLSAPQSQIYSAGASQSVKLLFGLTPFLDLGPSTSFTILPNRISGQESGVAWTFGGGLRLHRPHDAVSFYGISPWLDADLLYVRTGPLNRLGFDAAAGLSFPVTASRSFWVGPFVRYLHVGQPERAGFDNRDAKLFTIGLSFEFGTGLSPDASASCPACGVNTVSCPDSDGDTVPDTIDRCPDVKGPIENAGCPAYKKLVVQKDKLELKEKLYFAFDQATLEESSYPVLDEVVQALKDNKKFKVQIEGHTDSVGTKEHNQTLSEQRATTVLDYLAAHGIERARLVSKGFSSSAPTDTNVTVEGRENNRRVEFVVFFNIINDASVGSPQ